MRKAFTTLCFAALVAGCATPRTAVTPTPPTVVEGPKPLGVARVGDKATCPVTGDVFTVLADSPSAVFEGKTYFFCCDGCADDFKSNPAKYLQAAAPASATGKWLTEVKAHDGCQSETKTCSE